MMKAECSLCHCQPIKITVAHDRCSNFQLADT